MLSCTPLSLCSVLIVFACLDAVNATTGTCPDKLREHSCAQPFEETALLQAGRSKRRDRKDSTLLQVNALKEFAGFDIGSVINGEVFIGIKSAPQSEYKSRRDRLRSNGCLKSIRDAGFSFAFVMGVPVQHRHDLTAHDQGGTDTPQERQNEEALMKEIETHRDILLLSMRDQYADLTDKLIGILDFGIHQTNAQYVMEMDDDKCLVPSVLRTIIQNHHESNETGELWAGAYLFSGTEYAQMEGPTGIIAPYFSGNGCMLSRNLARTLVDDDRDHTVLSGVYGTTADDANLGKWVQYAQEKHDLKVVFKSDPSMLSAP